MSAPTNSTNPTGVSTSIDALASRTNRFHGSDVAVIGILLLLVGLTLMVEILGPSTTRTARVTASGEADRGRRSGDEQFVMGVDDRGAGFEISVSKTVREALEPGDRVEVTRSWLTGRVLSVKVWDRWHDANDGLHVIGIAATAIGAALSAFGLRRMLRATRSGYDVPWRSTLAWPAGFALVLSTGWVVYQRDQASTTSARAAYEATLTTEPPIEECRQLGVITGQQLFNLVGVAKDSGEMDAEEFEFVLSLIQEMEPDCTPESVEAEVCDYVADVIDSAPTFVVATGGRCPGLP